MTAMHPVRRGLAAMLLPLSAVPVALAVPDVVDNYESFSRIYLERDALPAPAVAFSGAERRSWQPVAATKRPRIPVLAYHGISGSDDGYSVSRESFARQMAMLDRAGFQTISADTYAKAIDGRDVELPRRPVLVTFDDSRVNAFRGADQVLERHGFRATMFAIAEQAAQRTPTYLRWSELRGMASSGRWDIQLHAGRGHRRIRTGPDRASGPFYANRAYAGGRRESRAAAYRRITTDLAWGAQQLAKHVPASSTSTFAVPYGSYGADHLGNDHELGRRVGAWLKQRYAATFVQRTRPRGSRVGDAHRVLPRYEVHTDTTTLSLYAWLCGCELKEGRS